MKKYVERECKKHGISRYVLEKRGAYRCTKCRADNVARRRRKIKALLIQELGGRCKLCGYKKCQEALTFHHIDPSTKEFGLSHRGLTRSFEVMLREAKKCELLCLNCHTEIHVTDPR